MKSIRKLFRLCQVFEKLLVIHCIRHLLDFHYWPKILHTIYKPITREYILTTRLFYQLVISISYFDSFGKQNLMHTLCSTTANYHKDLQGKHIEHDWECAAAEKWLLL
jgi:hypothetical protein